MIDTDEETKAELDELREEAFQAALEMAFNEQYEKFLVVFLDNGHCEEDAAYLAREEARSRARDYCEDYFVEPDQ